MTKPTKICGSFLLHFLLCLPATGQQVATPFSKLLETKTGIRCLSDEMKSREQQNMPGLKSVEENFNKTIYHFLTSQQFTKSATGVTYIPVVVHIMHNNGAENISDAFVIQGIQDLNEAFSNSGAYTNASGVDTQIQFCLASQDPSGNFTTGITRTLTPLTDMIAETDDINLKLTMFWPTNKYLNIWLVREITSLSIGSGVAGYATLPYTGGAFNGIVNEARWFGSSTDNSKIHIHEAGHFLGLYHTFEGGCNNNNCLTDGDKICDTPPDASTAPVGCGTSVNTCTTDDDDLSIQNPFRPVSVGGLGDQQDMISNYMDYGYQNCQSHFTQGQSDRMNAVLSTLLNYFTLSSGCANPCGFVINSFSHSLPYYSLSSGDVFSDTARTTASVPASYQWMLDSTIISSDTILSYTFTTQGDYKLTFKIFNTALQCYSQKTFSIRVTCPVQSSFTVTPFNIQAGNTVTCTSTTVGATSYQWFLDGQLAGNASVFTTSFASNGKHHLYLVTGSGVCSDTSNLEYLAVGDCNTGEFNNWYFASKNAITFNNTVPANLPDGANDTSFTHVSFLEGCATISDRNGHLLFYTDGQHIFNRQHQLMSDSLLSGPSSTQGGFIVPDPSNSNLYYVFYIENGGGDTTWYPTGGGFGYAVVDMNLNGGLGDVAGPLVKLLNTSTEQIAAVKHCNNHDIWIVTHGFNMNGISSNEFYSFLVTDNGIMPPVISAIGLTQSATGFLHGSEATLKISPKGNRIASACLDFGTIEYGEFDNNTGIISNLKDISTPLMRYPYGLEFSPDGNNLYAVAANSFILPNKLYQYDLTSQVDSIIRNSLNAVATFNATAMPGALQLAPDGKIYGAILDAHLYSIDHPNEYGANCQYNQQGIQLKSYTLYGLPGIIANNMDSGKPEILGPQQICASTQNVAYSIACSDSSIWIYKGINQVISVNQNKITLSFTTNAIDTLIAGKMTDCYGILYDTLLINVNAPSVNIGADTLICSSGSLILAANGNFGSYLWSTGSTANTDTITTSGIYILTVTGIGGCQATDTIVVGNFNSNLSMSLGPDIFTACTGIYTQLSAPAGNFTSYLWGSTSPWATFIGNTNANTQLAFGLDTIEVWLKVTDILGCTANDTILVAKHDNSQQDIFLNDTTICNGQVVILDAGYHLNYTYYWQNILGGQTLTVYSPGTYVLTYFNSCGNVFYDTVLVSGVNSPQVFIGNDTLLCPFIPFVINPQTGSGNYLWQDGSTSSTFSVNTPGLYWLAVSSGNGCYGIDSMFVEECTSVQQNSLQNNFVLYPNPATNILYIKTNEGSESKIERLVISNMLGQEVYSTDKYFKETDISDFAAGVYTVNLITSDGIWLKQFAKIF